eukprot:scaffold144290_cov18-Tisochrysis_lutea.AAC.2
MEIRRAGGLEESRDMDEGMHGSDSERGTHMREASHRLHISEDSCKASILTRKSLKRIVDLTRPCALK